MVRQLAKTANHLSVFIRNKAYIGPGMGSGVSNKSIDPDSQIPDGSKKHFYTAKEKEVFSNEPDKLLVYRQSLERKLCSMFWLFYRGSKESAAAKEYMHEYMSQRLGDRTDIKDKFIPEWSPGCRRYMPSENYLETLCQPHVSPVFDPMIKVVPEGIVTADGKKHELEMIACVTGFNVAFIPHFCIQGLDGQVMQDQQDPNIYGAIVVPGFPNYFVVNGPRGN